MAKQEQFGEPLTDEHLTPETMQPGIPLKQRQT